MTTNKTRLPDDFDGTARLFPLPNLVMFPHVMQPLHIFEPRYRDMVEDALASDQLIAMARLAPGWEQERSERPSLAPTTCISRIVSHTRLDDGKFNILALGLRRAEILTELPPRHLYREAKVAVVEDLYPSATQERTSIQRELLHCFRQFTPESPAAQEQFESLMSNRLPLGVLTDIIGFTMKFDLDLKQRLLSEADVDERARLLLDALRTFQPTDQDTNDDRPFPPAFSIN